MPHYAKRLDANHTAIVDALQKRGVYVIDLADSGKGVCDIITFHKNKVVFIELKHGNKAALKKTQVRFLCLWPGYAGIAQNETEAINLATDPIEYALTDPQKNKLAEFYMKMTADKVHLPTILRAIAI